MTAPISVNYFQLKRSRFHGDINVNGVVRRQIKANLSVCLSEHLFGRKIKKNDS